jgi:hypothetical protein
MIGPNNRKRQTAGLKYPKIIPDPTKGMVFQIIESSANDNLMPATKWFTWLIAWTIIVGAALAYAIF